MNTTLVQAVDLSTDEQTDTGNADKLIALHGDKLRYVPSWGWLVYDGKRWQIDEAGQIMELAKDTVRAMRMQAAEMDDKRDAGALWDHARRSQSRQRLEAMVALAKSDPAVRASVDDFDTNPWLFNVQNGTLDLRTGEQLPHNSADLITRLSPIEYDSQASSDIWARFLSDIMCGNAELISYLQHAAGYSLTGNTGEKAWFFCYGPGGNNGKSTFLEALRYVMGDYGATVTPETLMTRSAGTIPNDIARLAGIRYVCTGEPDEGQQFNMGLLKQLTGSDTISARFLQHEWFDFKPQFKLWLAANYKPGTRDAGDAAFDRIKLIPFDASFSKDKRDKDLPRKLREAAPAILAWAVQGCKRWQDDGLHEPEIMREAVKDYQGQQDSMVLFLDDWCQSSGSDTLGTVMKDAYDQWRILSGEDAPTLSNQAFYDALEAHGHKVKRTHGKRRVTGLILKDREVPRSVYQPVRHQPDPDRPMAPEYYAKKWRDEDGNEVPF